MAIDYTLSGKALRESIEQDVNKTFSHSSMEALERSMIVMMIEEAIFEERLKSLNRLTKQITDGVKKPEGVKS
jgi:hypothetical protein